MSNLLYAPALPASALDPVTDVFDSLQPISLERVNRKAGLQDRVDTKFIATPQQMVAFVESLRDQMDILTIDGQHTFAYDSIYFDSPHLLTYREHLQGRRRRFKIRTRVYVDTGLKVLEVKTKGLRGRTEKVRINHEGAADELNAESRAFIQARLNEYNIPNAAAIVNSLRPTLRTSYHRATLVGRYRPFRMTVDTQLGCATGSAATSTLNDRVLIETKTPTQRDELIKALNVHGIRKVKMSKYCAGIGILEPGMPSQPWNPVIKKHLLPAA